MRFARHYIEACQQLQPAPPPSLERTRRTLSSVELGLIAELAMQGTLDADALKARLAERDAAPPHSLVGIMNAPRTVLGKQARFVQIEAEAMFAALLVREGVASLAWILRFLDEDRATWLGVSLVRERVLQEADVPWLFENRRLLHGRAQAWQAQGFLDDANRSLPSRLDRWLLCPRDTRRSNVELLRLAVPKAIELLSGADLDRYKPASPTEHERPYEGLVHGYRIAEAISQGSRGVVYRARHLFTNREVALKVIPLRHPNNFGRAAELWREAVAMSRVVGSHVVNTYDFGGCKDYYYYASDLIPGRLLHDVDRAALSTVAVARDVALALVSIRDAGVVHRDVIPSNILVGDDGVTRLLDYGDVWFDSDVRVPGRSPPGTIPYIAPEEIAATAASDPDAAPRVDQRSDQYMLGIVLFELLTGTLPFTGSPDEYATWVATAVIPRVRTLDPTISPVLDRLVERMTRASPTERFQSLEALVAAIESAAS